MSTVQCSSVDDIKTLDVCIMYNSFAVIFMVTGPPLLDLRLGLLPHLQEIYLVLHLHLEHLQHYLLVCHLEFLPLHKQVLGSLEALLVRLDCHLGRPFLQQELQD